MEDKYANIVIVFRTDLSFKGLTEALIYSVYLLPDCLEHAIKERGG